MVQTNGYECSISAVLPEAGIDFRGEGGLEALGYCSRFRSGRRPSAGSGSRGGRGVVPVALG